MPQHLGTGYEQMPVINDFVWIAEQTGKVIGILMAAPCHGVLFLVRARVEKDAPKITISLLFRKCMRDAVDRGFKGFFTFIDPTIETERRFIPICQLAGGIQIPTLQIALVGKLETAARF